MSTTGEPPDLISDPNDNYQANIIICAVITWIIAASFVGARFYTRRWLIHVLGPEDWVILASLLFSALTSAGIIEQVSYGLGRHFLDLNLAYYIPMSRAGWYTILWYQTSLLLTKTSILLLYTRILHYQHARHAAHAILLLVIASNIFTLIATATACVPLPAFWDPTVAGHCHPRSYWWANTGMHMATDFLIFSLPLPIIFTLKIGRRQKVLLYATFAFGFVTSLMSVIRLLYLLKEYLADFTYDDTTLTYWTCIEVNTAIVCSCVMTLKPLINRFLPDLVRSPDVSPHRHGSVDLGDGGSRPLTIGSMPIRGDALRHQSWIVLANSDSSMKEREEELELINPGRIETRLDRKLGLPVRPESAYVPDPRSPDGEYQDGAEVRPSSRR